MTTTYTDRHYKYYHKHRKQVLSSIKHMYLLNPEPMKRRTAAWKKSNPDCVRDQYYKKQYGLSLSTYNTMLALHNGGCWICAWTPVEGKRRLCVDHDHQSGQVRGLLCMRCNKRLIGHNRREHAFLYDNAANYLRSRKNWGKAVNVKRRRKKRKG